MKVRTKNFDVEGMSSGRLFRQHLFSKMRPFWCFSDGLETKHIVALMTRHYLGYPIAYLTTRYEPQWRKALFQWRRLTQTSKSNDQKKGK